MNIKFDYLKIRTFLVFSILFELPIFERLNDTVDKIFMILHVFVILYCFFEIIILRNTKKINVFFVPILIFILWAGCVICLFTNGSIMAFLKESIYPIILSCVLCYCIFYKNVKKTFQALAQYYYLTIWLNFVCMIICPNGIIISDVGSIAPRANWLFGSKNNIVVILPIILFVISCNKILNVKTIIQQIFYYLTLVVLSISFSSMGDTRFELLSGSTTAIIMIVMYFIIIQAITVLRSFGHNIFLNLSMISIFSFIIMLFVVEISQLQGGFISDLVSMTGKNTGFSGRYSVWKSALNDFFTSPVYGIGMKSNIYRTYENAYSTNTSIYRFWLEFLVRYGIVGVLIFLNICFLVDKFKSNGYDRINTTLCVSYFMLMIGGLMYPIGLKYIFFMLGAYIMWLCYGFNEVKI